MRHARLRGRPIALFCILLIAGCVGGGPAVVEVPDVDPEEAAAEALDIYDKDGDGALAGAELEQVPAIQSSLNQYDKDGDQRVSQAELAQRIDAFYTAGLGLSPVDAVVKLDRVPLDGATVRLEPEPFLGDAVKPAEGVTDRAGMARIAVPDELLPEEQRGLNAMQVGIYKVRITHPSRKIPAKYNEQTTLGFELDPKNVSATTPTFDLTSR